MPAYHGIPGIPCRIRHPRHSHVRVHITPAAYSTPGIHMRKCAPDLPPPWSVPVNGNKTFSLYCKLYDKYSWKARKSEPRQEICPLTRMCLQCENMSNVWNQRRSVSFRNSEISGKMHTNIYAPNCVEICINIHEILCLNQKNSAFSHRAKAQGARTSALYKTRQICTKNIQSTVTKSTCKRLKTYNPGLGK